MSQEPGGATLDQEFAVEGLTFKTETWYRRGFNGTRSFIVKKPMGAFGVALILFWTVFAVGTVGDGGGWLGIGRYNSLDVFRVANTGFADNKAADVIVGSPTSITAPELSALFENDTEWLGTLPAAAGVDVDMQDYIQGRIANGTLLSFFLADDPQLLEEIDGTYVRFDEVQITSISSPVTTARLLGPSSKHWFGTDRAGQDLYARVAEGARLSLTVGFFAALFASFVGTVIGLVSGFLGGTTDLLFNRIMDAIQAFPPLVFLLLMRSVVEDRDNLFLLVLILGVLGIAGTQRIVRGSVIAASQEQYIEAARTIGAGSWRIMFRHLLPNVFSPIIVVFSISIGLYILLEATLSFLGLGPTQVSWGRMVSDGRQFIISGGAPWISLFAGLAITTLVFGFNMAGDALRDVLDPRLRGT